MAPRPKFCVGEEVDCSAFEGCPRSEIIDIAIIRGLSTDHYEYKVFSIGWMPEFLITKLPPEERLSWDDCVWSPHKIS